MDNTDDILSVTTDSDNSDDESTTSCINNKYYLVIPEFYHEVVYGGQGNEINPILANHIMVRMRFQFKPQDTFMLLLEKVAACQQFFRRQTYLINFLIYSRMFESEFLATASPIRNFFRITENANKYMQLEIAECIILPTGETVCVLKTIWLKIIQRRWKKVYADKILFLQNIYHRQVYGKLPGRIPSLKGMLVGYFKKKTFLN